MFLYGVLRMLTIIRPYFFKNMAGNTNYRELYLAILNISSSRSIMQENSFEKSANSTRWRYQPHEGRGDAFPKCEISELINLKICSTFVATLKSSSHPHLFSLGMIEGTGLQHPLCQTFIYYPAHFNETPAKLLQMFPKMFSKIHKFPLNCSLNFNKISFK